MKRRLLVALLNCLLFGLLLSSMTFAQDAFSGITVSGTGTAYGEPDQAVVELGVNILDGDLTAANDEATSVATQILETLSELGIEQKDVRTSQFNVWSEDEYRANGEIGSRKYRVNNVLSVTLRDISQLGAVLAQSIEAGANSVGSIHFTLSDPKALEVQARERAMDEAKAKAEQLAELAGVSLGQVVMITDVTSFGSPDPFPMARMEAMSAAADSVPVATGQLSVSSTVQVRFTIEAIED